MFTQFQEWSQNRHAYAREWKERIGGKVLGYFCTYVPEEILYAAGVLPVRILGSHEPQDVTEPYIFGMYCPFCRDCLAQGLKGRYDYLDGIMIAQSCLHIRQTFTSWKLHIPTEFAYYMYMPNNVQTPAAVPYLRGELATFKQAVEEWTGRQISDEDLDRATEVYNANRRMMRQVYELRKAERPPLSGLEALHMVIASQLTDKADHNRVLEQVLSGLPGRSDRRPAGERLMLVGSEDDDTDFVTMVESLGATIVIDEHCTGSRYFWNEVQIADGRWQIADSKQSISHQPSAIGHQPSATGDRLGAIARRYVERPACPSKDWPERTRLAHVMKLARDYDVQGVIMAQQKFCDPHELDIPPLTWALEEQGIPTLFLEFDVTVPVGQFRTRVEAFLEMMRQEELF